MRALNRRLFMTSAMIAATLFPAFARAAGPLPQPASTGGKTLLEALALRRSTRLYSENTVDEEMLSTLLWAAYGVNRPASGGRTAPSWRTSYGTDIYVADANGVRRYDPAAHSMETVLGEDIRTSASPQPFVVTAPVVLIYVADLARMNEAPREEQLPMAHVDAAMAAQNVYLYCASVGLGTCLVGGADKAGLTKLLNLPDTQIVTFVQPVGHPA
ncbi:MAG: nitroreductase family protein [Rhizobiaceae bacterium]